MDVLDAYQLFMPAEPTSCLGLQSLPASLPAVQACRACQLFRPAEPTSCLGLQSLPAVQACRAYQLPSRPSSSAFGGPAPLITSSGTAPAGHRDPTLGALSPPVLPPRHPGVRKSRSGCRRPFAREIQPLRRTRRAA
eukprot:364602-Chlamydomonas_euryale.AAC.7